MKVIDLLNKIAKGEKFDNCKIKFKEIEPEEVSEYFLFDRLYEEDLNLNDEIEIIEEKNDIEKLKLSQFANKQKKLATKINELIDKVNSISNKE